MRITISGASEVSAYFKRAQDNVKRYTRDATLRSLDLVEKSVAKRVRPARSENVQDARTYRTIRAQKPYKTSLDASGQSGEVSLRAHLTTARSAALINVFGKLGLSKKLERKGLYIDPSSWIKGPDGKFKGRKKMRYNGSTNKTLILYRFNRYPHLLDWSQRRDKGYQFMRHSVRVQLEALNILAATPALRENKNKISAEYDSAVARAFLGG